MASTLTSTHQLLSWLLGSKLAVKAPPVGGAIHGNAHFRGRLISEVIAVVTLVDRRGSVASIPAAEMGFADGWGAAESQDVLNVLVALTDNHGQLVTKNALLDQVWGDRFVSESALTSRIRAARRAVGDDGQQQRVIRTVHARGYIFVAEVTIR